MVVVNLKSLDERPIVNVDNQGMGKGLESPPQRMIGFVRLVNLQSLVPRMSVQSVTLKDPRLNVQFVRKKTKGSTHYPLADIQCVSDAQIKQRSTVNVPFVGQL